MPPESSGVPKRVIEWNLHPVFTCPTAHTLSYAFSHSEYLVWTNYQVQLDVLV